MMIMMMMMIIDNDNDKSKEDEQEEEKRKKNMTRIRRKKKKKEVIGEEEKILEKRAYKMWCDKKRALIVAYHESVNVDANMDRCMRYKMNLYVTYVCIDTRARSKPCSSKTNFFNVQNMIEVYF